MTDKPDHDQNPFAEPSDPVRPADPHPVAAQTPSDAPEVTDPEPARVPRVWPRVLGVLVLVLGAGGTFAWLNPGPVRHALDGLLPGDPAEDAAMKALDARIARLEGRPAPDLAPLIKRLDALEKRPLPVPPPAPAVDLAPVIARLEALEQRGPIPAGSGADLRPLLARLDALEKQTPADPAKIEALSSRIEAVASADPAAALRARLEATEQKLGGLAAASSTVADHQATIARAQTAAAALAAGHPLGVISGAPPALARFADTAPPTLATLRLTFPAAEHAALKVSVPDTEGKPFVDRMLARLQDFHLITVREGDTVLIGNKTAAVLSHAHTLLDAGDIAGAAKAVGGLSGPPAAAMAAWLSDANALLAAQDALAALAGRG